MCAGELGYAWLASKPTGKFTLSKMGSQKIKEGRVLHVVPYSLIETPDFHGSSKDIRNLETFLKTVNNNAVDRLYSPRGWRTIKSILSAKKARELTLPSYRAIIINMPGKTGLTCFFLWLITSKSQQIIVRSHNAEFFHHFEISRVMKNPIERLCGQLFSLSYLFSDFLTGCFANCVLSISRYDRFHYWRHLAQNTVHLPYMPTSLSKSKGTKKTKRHGKYIVSVGSAKSGGLIAKDQEISFYDAVKNTQLLSKYVLIQTNAQCPHLAPDFITTKGYVQDFEKLMQETAIVVVAGDLGWGTKTKIADAVADGTRVIVSERVFQRLDTEFKAGCIPFGPNADCKTLSSALETGIICYEEDLKNQVSDPFLKLDGISDICINSLTVSINRKLPDITAKYDMRDGKPSHKTESNRQYATLFTVLYELTEQFINNAQLVSSHNPGQLNWLIILNISNQTSLEAFQKKLRSRAPNITFLFLPGCANRMPMRNSGSYNHAMGIQLGLSYLQKKQIFEFILIDPDFYICQPDWINKLSRFMLEHQVDMLSSTSDLSMLTHSSNTPSAHFMYLRLNQRSLNNLDFSPDLFVGEQKKAKARHIFKRLEAVRKLNPIFNKLAKLDLYRRHLAQNGDTGFRNFFYIADLNCKFIEMGPTLSTNKSIKSLNSIGRFINLCSPLAKRKHLLEKTNKRFAYLQRHLELGEMYFFQDLYANQIFAIHAHNSLDRVSDGHNRLIEYALKTKASINLSDLEKY